MEALGALLGLPVALAISFFYPRCALRLIEHRPSLRLPLHALSCLVVGTIGIEAVWLARDGFVGAYDSHRQELNALQGWNTLLGPAALTNAVLIPLVPRRSAQTALWAGRVVCFLALGFGGAFNVFYDDATHYRTDSEGTYRIAN